METRLASLPHRVPLPTPYQRCHWSTYKLANGGKIGGLSGQDNRDDLRYRTRWVMPT